MQSRDVNSIIQSHIERMKVNILLIIRLVSLVQVDRFSELSWNGSISRVSVLPVTKLLNSITLVSPHMTECYAPLSEDSIGIPVILLEV